MSITLTTRTRAARRRRQVAVRGAVLNARSRQTPARPHENDVDGWAFQRRW